MDIKIGRTEMEAALSDWVLDKLSGNYEVTQVVISDKAATVTVEPEVVEEVSQSGDYETMRDYDPTGGMPT